MHVRMIVMETPFQMQLMYVHVIITLTKLTSEESKTLLLGRILIIKIHLFGNLGDEGREIIQKINSAPGIAIGGDMLAGVEFEGTIFVSCCSDDDWIGSIFSFQVMICLFSKINCKQGYSRTVPISTCS